MTAFPAIYTDRLLLRNFLVSDVSATFDVFSNDSVTEFYDLDTFTYYHQAEHFVNSCIDLNREFGKRAFRWAICMKSEPNIVIGSCGFHSANKSFFSIEIGYELNHAFWGKNIAYEAVDAMLSYCFKNNFPFLINRVSATTSLDSVKSIKLLVKLGFTEEGVLRQFGYWKSAFHDVRLFSLLYSEWDSRVDKKKGLIHHTSAPH